MKAAARFIPPPTPPRIPDTDEAREALRRLVNKRPHWLKVMTWCAEADAAQLQQGGWPIDRLFNPPQSVWEELGRHYAWMDALPPADDGEVEWPGYDDCQYSGEE